jgi:hypothetical protein
MIPPYILAQCDKLGWTEPEIDAHGKWWAYPPGASIVMKAPLPSIRLEIPWVPLPRFQLNERPEWNARLERLADVRDSLLGNPDRRMAWTDPEWGTALEIAAEQARADARARARATDHPTDRLIRLALELLPPSVRSLANAYELIAQTVREGVDLELLHLFYRRPEEPTANPQTPSADPEMVDAEAVFSAARANIRRQVGSQPESNPDTARAAVVAIHAWLSVRPQPELLPPKDFSSAINRIAPKQMHPGLAIARGREFCQSQNLSEEQLMALIQHEKVRFHKGSIVYNKGANHAKNTTTNRSLRR